MNVPQFISTNKMLDKMTFIKKGKLEITKIGKNKYSAVLFEGTEPKYITKKCFVKETLGVFERGIRDFNHYDLEVKRIGYSRGI